VRRVALLLLLLPALAFAEEEPAPDPVAGLPGCLKPGATGVFTQGPVEGRLRGTLTYKVEAGEAAGTVRVLSDFATADLGPLTFRYRLRAVLDAKARRFTSFTYELGGSDPKKFHLLSRLGPDPDREGRWLHERFRYREGGEATVTKNRPKLPPSFALDLLEPFCAGLEAASEDGTSSLRILTVERGRVLRQPAEYKLLGKGKMEISGVSVPCRILTRVRGDDRDTVYLRTSDLMPLRHGTTRMKEPE
jgi:hypothetical protein